MKLHCEYLGRAIFDWVQPQTAFHLYRESKIPYVYNYLCIIYPEHEPFENHKDKKPIWLTNFLSEESFEHTKKIYLHNDKKQIKVIDTKVIPVRGGCTTIDNKIKTMDGTDYLEFSSHNYSDIRDETYIELENKTTLDLIREVASKYKLDKTPTIEDINKIYTSIEDFDSVVINIVMNLNTYNEVFTAKNLTNNDEKDFNNLFDFKLQGNGILGHLFVSKVIIFDGLDDGEMIFASQHCGKLFHKEIQKRFHQLAISIPHDFEIVLVQYKTKEEEGWNEFPTSNDLVYGFDREQDSELMMA